MKNISVIEDEKLSKGYDRRFVVIDKDTGEILDDAQGFGYKTVQNAYSAYTYKHRDKKKDKIRKEKEKHIRKWMHDNKDFVNAMDTFSFEIAKGSWGPDTKFNAAFVKEMLKQNNLEVDFSANDLLKVWLKR